MKPFVRYAERNLNENVNLLVRKMTKITTNMRGFQQWMKEHPRKRTDGYFTFGGKALTHEQVKKIVDYAVEKGYRTEANIPANEVIEILCIKK